MGKGKKSNLVAKKVNGNTKHQDALALKRRLYNTIIGIQQKEKKHLTLYGHKYIAETSAKVKAF